MLRISRVSAMAHCSAPRRTEVGGRRAVSGRLATFGWSREADVYSLLFTRNAERCKRSGNRPPPSVFRPPRRRYSGDSRCNHQGVLMTRLFQLGGVVLAIGLLAQPAPRAQ